MAQGGLKKKQATAVKPAAAKRNRGKTTTKAAKNIKPKRRSAVQAAALSKKHTAALSSATEKLVSARVGHLELLEGANREENEKKSSKK